MAEEATCSANRSLPRLFISLCVALVTECDHVGGAKTSGLFICQRMKLPSLSELMGERCIGVASIVGNGGLKRNGLNLGAMLH